MSDIITIMSLGWKYAPPTSEEDAIEALHDVSCYVADGSFAGIVGPTGSGKTTIARSLTGIIPHLARGTMTGYARVADMNVKSTSVSNISRRVSFVSQLAHMRLFCTSVEEEIAFALANRGVEPDIMRQQVEDALDAMHIQGIRHRNPATLCAGEIERVAIAVALASEPRVIILDEPCAFLDEQGVADMLQALHDLHDRHRSTVVMIEQDTSQLAPYADSIFLAVNGEIIRRTTPDIFIKERALLESVGVHIPTDTQTHVEIEEDQRVAQNPPVIMNHVKFRYEESAQILDEPPAIDDVSVEIEQGSFVGILGENASGKSTLLQLLTAQLRPQDGQLVVDGKDVASQSVSQMARHIAYVGQYPDEQLFCETVRAQIAFGLRAQGVEHATLTRRVQEMLHLFNLTSVADVSPLDISFGQQRATVLAAALAVRAPILLLDEPTAGLDARLSHRFLNTVAALNREGTTVIMVDHHEEDVERYCTHALRLDHGKIVTYGKIAKPEALPLNPPAPSFEETGEQIAQRIHASRDVSQL